MGIYSRALNHIDMIRVKELREEKIKRRKDAKEFIEQIRDELRNLNSPEFSNWRCNIDEGMTSSGLFQTNLPAMGDVDLVTTEQTFDTRFNGGNDSVSGSEVHLSGSSNSIVGGSHTIYRRAMFKVDASKASTLKLTIAKGGGTSSWTDRDPAQSFDDHVNVNVYSDNDPFASSFVNDNMGSGTHLITLPKNYSNLVIQIEQFAKVSGTGTLRIIGASLQRRTPVSVFVALDSPEATAFIRTDPTMKGLSAEERKKKLMDMLDAGDEYLLKYLGLIGSSARPSDTTMPDSWEQAAGDTDAMSDDLYNWMWKTYGNPAAEWKKNNPSKPDNSNPHLPKGAYVPLAGVDDNYGDIAATYGGADAERKQKLDAWKKKNTMPGRGIYPYRPGTTQPYNPQTGLDLSAHYEPQGEVLSEKKKLKSVKDVPIKKISGYYDGKPAPLGFPMQEPPKMIDGYHPDLVTPEGQKKQSNRYNRLDPASAKAMPPTGNPHIDKKVRAAAKKPK